MKQRTFVYLCYCVAFTLLACNKSNHLNNQEQELTVLQDAANLSGATQISGIGFYATSDECDYTSQGSDYAIRITGDLEGCLYAFIYDYECSPSGTYREEGREYFVGTYNGQPGTFWTTYKFEARYEGCSPEGGPLGAEIFGRCQHPIVDGSGTGIFNDVTGQINFKDDIEAGNFPYRGQLRF
jgi:hypothetical protein